MNVKQGMALVSIALILTACVNTRSGFMEATGAKAGELPVFARPDYQIAQANFRTKLAQFRNINVMPADVANYVNCELSEPEVQALAGYTDMLAVMKPAKKKGSLAAEVAQDAGAAGSAVTSSQRYVWQGGSVLSGASQCKQLRSDHKAPGLNYLVNSQYALITEVHTSSGSVPPTTHTTKSQVYVENKAADEQVSMTISSINVAGGMFDSVAAKATLTMNHLEDPNFSYQYRKAGDQLVMTETASARGVYHTHVSLELEDGKKRMRAYAGKELIRISRSRHGKPHGLQESFKFNLPSSCYDNGEQIQSSSCERF